MFNPVIAALVGFEHGDGLDRRATFGAFDYVGDKGEDLLLRGRDNSCNRHGVAVREPRPSDVNGCATEYKDEQDDAEDLHGSSRLSAAKPELAGEVLKRNSERGGKKGNSPGLRIEG